MEWIKFTDENPPLEEKEYLVYLGGDVDIYTWEQFRCLGKEWIWKDRDGFWDKNVTHWMPLPSPPKK